MKRISARRGFTLVEMIVAVGLFAVVMLVSITALMALVEANRKAQALQSVMNNLNVAVDGMVRSIREGHAYYCNGIPLDASTNDCASEGGTLFSFIPFSTGSIDPPRWIYSFDTEAGVGRLYKSETGNQNEKLPITSPEVDIESVTFYVIGSSKTEEGATIQPKVTVVIKGVAGQKVTARSTFHVQATAVQRLLDI